MHVLPHEMLADPPSAPIETSPLNPVINCDNLEYGTRVDPSASQAHSTRFLMAVLRSLDSISTNPPRADIFTHESSFESDLDTECETHFRAALSKAASIVNLNLNPYPTFRKSSMVSSRVFTAAISMFFLAHSK